MSEELLVQIEHYIDPNPYEPKAYANFLARAATVYQELDFWNSIAFDSATYMAIAARYEAQFLLNPHAKDGRQWYGYATERTEQMLQVQVGSWPIDVYVAAHVDEQKDDMHGFILRNPSMPGRLRKLAASGYGEFYHQYLFIDEDGRRSHVLQTEIDNYFNASTQIEAPNGCLATYDALWENWPEEMPRPPIHVLVYGEPGSGKSTFIATARKPLLVFMFDPMGKDTPYKKVGKRVEGEVCENGVRVERVYAA